MSSESRKRKVPEEEGVVLVGPGAELGGLDPDRVSNGKYECQCGAILDATNVANVEGHFKGKKHAEGVARRKKAPAHRLSEFFQRAEPKAPADVPPSAARVGSMSTPADVPTSAARVGSMPSEGEDERPPLPREGQEQEVEGVDDASESLLDSAPPVQEGATAASVCFCEGLREHNFPWVDGAATFLAGYPVEVKDVPWIVDSRAVFRSTACTRTVADGDICKSCTDLPYTRQWRQAVERAREYNAGNTDCVNNVWLSKAAVEEKAKRYRTKMKMVVLDMSTCSAKVARLNQAVSLHAKLLQLIAAADVPRIATLINVQLRSKASVRAIIGAIESAAAKTYQVKSFSGTEIDFCILVLRIGGCRLLKALEQCCGLAARSTVLAAARTYPSFSFCHTGLQWDTVRRNMATAFECKKWMPRVGMCDEVATNPALDVDVVENVLTGVCYEHVRDRDTELTFADVQVVYDVEKQLEGGSLHLAKEALLFMVGGLGMEEYTAVPVMGVGTCKKGSVQCGEEVIRGFLRAWKDQNEATAGPMWAFASDGDTKRRMAMNNVLRVQPLAAEEPVLQHLTGLDMMGGEDGCVAVFDFKHLQKRLRNRLISVNVHLTVGESIITAAHIQAILQGHADDRIRSAVKSMMFPGECNNYRGGNGSYCSAEVGSSNGTGHQRGERQRMRCGRYRPLAYHAIVCAMMSYLCCVCDCLRRPNECAHGAAVAARNRDCRGAEGHYSGVGRLRVCAHHTPAHVQILRGAPERRSGFVCAADSIELVGPRDGVSLPSAQKTIYSIAALP
eukprot:GHVU01164460.1.p1 GENE.GHVU01164460.1~~GHVU01164460.1.p1  ORF type:complete len:790 (+),score=84.92 GHVU01164460.1:211-2580(+)